MNRSDKQHGAVLVELALLLGPLLVLAFGITEYGRAMYQYNAIAKAVRDSARHLSQFAPGDPIRIGEARSLVFCGATDCAGRAPLVPGLTPDHVQVSDRTSNPAYNLQPTGRGTVNLVRVEVVGFDFRTVAPAFVGDVEFAPIHATMVQVL
ncbi:TadE/TadG family type IV pilus assembly protein [Massilia soli]|uniref:Pilus assembly protein n=1 Tax=Massilia soli TaxID=2792854 RepID=A0ABS7SRH7_9BURK|nr:TadE/TadG family type IV pilus assembly protein [Massilia soli]MBZ2208552.1 pilus assembly protein [Massilia soli]